MTLKKMYVCSVCGTERKDANHWFVLTETKAGFHLQSWEWAMGEEVLDKEGTEHLCGQVCAHTLLDRFMSGVGIGERNE